MHVIKGDLLVLYLLHSYTDGPRNSGLLSLGTNKASQVVVLHEDSVTKTDVNSVILILKLNLTSMRNIYIYYGLLEHPNLWRFDVPSDYYLLIQYVWWQWLYSSV